MNLKLLFEEGTKQETIEHLVGGVPRVVPVSLSLSVLGERYSKGRVWMYNLRQLGTKFLPNGVDEYLFIFTHTPFSYTGSGKFPIFEWIGEHPRCTPYAGLCDNDDRIIVVGGENSSSDGNVKIASHEITHALLKHPATWNFSEVHCNNYVGSKRCIMNAIDVPETIEEVSLSFCQPCTDALKDKIKD